MVFRIINECRRLAIQNTSLVVGFNGPVAAFIDQSYVATQLLAIRRLTERSQRSDAITLPRLLEDMRANADLFTRELYVCHDGLPFDPGPARERSLRRLSAEAEKNNGVQLTWLATTGPEAYDMAVRVREHFDRLIGAGGKPRSRDDELERAIFDRIKSKLGLCDGLNKVASKFIAHAADAGSRGQLNGQERKITLNRIEACQRAICRVAALVHGPLLYIGESGLIPTPQFNHLENLDRAWLDPSNFQAIASYWDERAEEVERWTTRRLGMDSYDGPADRPTTSKTVGSRIPVSRQLSPGRRRASGRARGGAGPACRG